MAELRTHDRCRHYGYYNCLHKGDEIMKQALQPIPEHYGRRMATISVPPREEVDKICNDCDSFTSK
jgi:hypothetical protein